jgi:predicted lipoprotein
MSAPTGVATDKPSLMSRLFTPRNVGIVAAVALLVAMGFSTKVIKISDATSAQVFNAADYAKAHYDSTIVPAIDKQATDLGTVLKAIATDGEKAKTQYGHSSNPYNPYAYAVTLTGVAGDATDTEVPLTVDGLPDGTTVNMLLVTGTDTSIRDVTGLVNLNQFLNQVEYLNASLELNKQVTDTVIVPFLSKNPAASLAGKTLKITGAFTDDANGTVNVVPISIEVVS